MAFHVRITLTDVHKKPSRGIIAIGDTVLIDEMGKQTILTNDVQRKYSEISYSFDVDEKEEDEDMKDEEKDG